MTKTCKLCHEKFNTTDKRRKFCSVKCYHIKAKLRPTGFKKGHTTWNKGIKGIRMSPSTEFKKGQKSTNWVPVGTITIRTHKGKQRAWQKTAEPNIWKMRAVVVWDSHNGPLPVKKLVHHKDRNSLNDTHTNLQAMTRAEHLIEHRSEFRRPSFKRDDRLKDKICTACSNTFSGYVNAQFCHLCATQRRRESQQRYKIKISSLECPVIAS